MKKYVLIPLFFLILTYLLTGCWDKKELSSLSIVEAIGIDLKEDGQVSISFQILKPSELKSGGKKSIWVTTSTGETVFDAIRNASLQTDRRLFLPHNKIIIIGEETAKKGVIHLMDFLSRDAEARGLAYVFVAKGKALDILKGEHEQETNPSKAIENLAETSIIASNLPKRYIKDLFFALGSKTPSPILPGITTQKKNSDGKSIDMVILDDTAVFEKDRLVGWFNHAESRGALWVLNEVEHGSIVVESPLEEDKFVSLEIITASTKLKPEINDDNLSITIEVDGTGNLTEQMSAVDLMTPKNFAELERKAGAIIEEEIKAALSKSQKWGCDIFKFGEEFHRKYPHEWPELEQDWDKVFSKIEATLEVSFQLTKIGLSSEPLSLEDTE